MISPAQLELYAFDVVGIRTNVPNLVQSQPVFVSKRGRELFKTIVEMETFKGYFQTMTAKQVYFNACNAAMELALREGSDWADPVTTSNVARNRMANEMRGMRTTMMNEVNKAGFMQEYDVNRTKTSVSAYLTEGLVGVSCVAPFDGIKSQQAKGVMNEIVQEYHGLIDRGKNSIIFEAVRDLMIGVRINRFGFLEFYYDFTLPVEYVPADLMSPLPRSADLLTEFDEMWQEVMGIFQFSAARGKHNFI